MINEYKMVQVAIGEVKGYINPTESERAAAYELLVELSTRTSGAHLASTDDSIREALSDLQQLFDLTRSILRTHGTDASKGSPGNLSLAVVAVRVLNEVIRPVLSRWQPLLSDYEARRPIDAPDMSAVEWEQRWERGPQCRSELRGMRSSVRAYIDTLSRIAGAPDIADAILSVPNSKMMPKQAMSPSVVVPADVEPRPDMVGWFDARELVLMGLSLRPAKASITKMNETTDSFGEPAFTQEAEAGREFWFDYVADMGDAFDGTAPVAWLIGRKELEIPDDRFSEFPTPPRRMPHADLLVFGGDEVYTYAAAGRYESHTELPYLMGLEDGTGKEPVLLAIPGNHDWMGGIGHFEERFVEKNEFAGHWSTPQTHTWWHAKLPQGWWLWGIDTALDDRLVGDQQDYFRQAAERLEDGDRVILCSPVPLWQLRQKDRDAYAALRNTFDPLLEFRKDGEDVKATMPLCLSGDSHFFAHYERLDTDFGEDHITSGGGGAFLQPTHNLAERIPLEDGNAEFKLTSRWPRPADSRALAPGATTFLSRKYWPLMVLMGLLHVAYAGLVALWHAPNLQACLPISPTLESCEPALGTGWRTALHMTLRAPLGLAFLVLLSVAMIPLIKGNSVESKLTKGIRVYGLLTGVAVSATLILSEVIRQRSLPSGVWGYAIAALLGGALSIVVFFSMMRWVNSRIKASDTVAFSPAESTRFKQFLRFRIDRNGDLTCFAIGIDPVGKGWYESMKHGEPVPPDDPAGIPQLHYLWGKTYEKFRPTPIRISVSVSNPELPPPDPSNPDPPAPPPSPTEVFQQVSKQLINGGHTLMYGGYPGAGYTAQLHAIEVKRHAGNPEAEHHLINYVPDYLWDPTVADRHRRVMDVERVSRDRPADEPDEVRESRDLTAMRRHVAGHSELQIVVGGALEPGKPMTRVAPGIIEEAYIAVDSGVPLIVVGGFGGAAGLIARIMLGDLYPAEIDKLARRFRLPDPLPNGAPGVGFREMLARFRTTGSLRNGLTDGENAELLRSTDPETVCKLIIRSVHRIGSHHAP